MLEKAFKHLLTKDSPTLNICKEETTMTNEVIFSVSEGGAASITLNRPQALNSLSIEMLKPIGEKLKEWQANDQIHLIILRGAGEKGFCAGGDIKTLYKARSSQEAFQNAEIFLRKNIT